VEDAPFPVPFDLDPFPFSYSTPKFFNDFCFVPFSFLLSGTSLLSISIDPVPLSTSIAALPLPSSFFFLRKPNPVNPSPVSTSIAASFDASASSFLSFCSFSYLTRSPLANFDFPLFFKRSAKERLFFVSSMSLSPKRERGRE